MKKGLKGSNLVQYGIPTLLVGVVFGLGLFYFISSGQLLNFYAGSADMKRDTNDQTIGLLNTKNLIKYKAGDLGGTAQNPVMKCSYNRCTIDYGSYILNGVPSNFSEFIESSASSGGSDEIINLILQLADQLEQKGDTEGAQEFRDLANLGHFVSSIEKKIEDTAAGCKDNPDSKCFYDAMNNNTYGNDVPASIQKYLNAFDSNTSLYDLRDLTRVGHARVDLQTDPAQFNSNLTKNPNYAFLKVFDHIQNNHAYAPELKGIAITLSQYIEKLSRAHGYTTYALYTNSQGSGDISYTFQETDIVTGALLDNIENGNYGGSIDDMLNPQYSFTTDLTSGLICASGQSNDTGSHCVKP